MIDTSRTVNCRCLHHDLGHADSNWKQLENKSKKKKVFEAIEGGGGEGGGGRAGEGRAGGVVGNHGLWI